MAVGINKMDLLMRGILCKRLERIRMAAFNEIAETTKEAAI